MVAFLFSILALCPLVDELTKCLRSATIIKDLYFKHLYILPLYTYNTYEVGDKRGYLRSGQLVGVK
jgi:hypothetical protein